MCSTGELQRTLQENRIDIYSWCLLLSVPQASENLCDLGQSDINSRLDADVRVSENVL